jgi:hypothetical protein
MFNNDLFLENKHEKENVIGIQIFIIMIKVATIENRTAIKRF